MMEDTAPTKTYWAGFVDGKVYEISHISPPQLFLRKCDAKKHFCDVRKVCVQITEADSFKPNAALKKAAKRHRELLGAKPLPTPNQKDGQHE